MKKILKYRLDDFQYQNQVPDYSIEVINRIKNTFGDKTEQNQPFFGVIQSQDKFDNIINQLRNIRDPYMSTFGDKIDKKWINRQGGVANINEIMPILESYYSVENNTLDMNNISVYSDRFVNLIKAYERILGLYEVVGRDSNLIIESDRRLFNTYVGDHKSSRGIDGPGDRRQYGARIFAIQVAKADPLHLAPAIVNFRFKDSKLRIVYNDAFSNYYRESKYLHQILHIISSLPFTDTDSDDIRALSISKCQAQCAYYADYKSMDIHMLKEIDIQMVKDFCRLYNVPEDDKDQLLQFVINLSHQECILNDYLYQGETAKKSGLYPTHDPENWNNATILVGAIDDFYMENFGFKPEYIFYPRRLRQHQVYFKVNGDDSYVLFGDRLSPDQFNCLARHHSRVASYYNQIVEISKAGYSYDRVEYCKRIFALKPGQKGFSNKVTYDNVSFPESKYSVEKAVNALYHPENIPNFPHKSDLVIWTCAIMDCCAGTKGWKLAVTEIVNGNLDLFVKVQDLEISKETLDILNEDYWFRTCNTEWELPSSRTYNLIKKIINK